MIALTVSFFVMGGLSLLGTLTSGAIAIRFILMCNYSTIIVRAIALFFLGAFMTYVCLMATTYGWL